MLKLRLYYKKNAIKKKKKKKELFSKVKNCSF